MENQNKELFDEKKRAYFYSLYRNLSKDMVNIATKQGFFGEKGSTDDWRNVIRHSVVEVARVSELGKLINLNNKIIEEMKIATSLHDIGKKHEVNFLKTNGSNYESFIRTEGYVEELLVSNGVPNNIIDLLKSIGVTSFIKLDVLLKKGEWSDMDYAGAIIHYVDDYTVDDLWVMDTETLKGENALDKRSLRQASKQFSTFLDKDAVKKNIFCGETLHEAQRRIGHAIEKRIANRLFDQTGHLIIPTKIPEIIDQQIMNTILNW